MHIKAITDKWQIGCSFQKYPIWTLAFSPILKVWCLKINKLEGKGHFICKEDYSGFSIEIRFLDWYHRIPKLYKVVHTPTWLGKRFPKLKRFYVITYPVLKQNKK